jgi:hypothetical protein
MITLIMIALITVIMITVKPNRSTMVQINEGF